MFTEKLSEMKVGEQFHMLNYGDSVWMRVRLPETYEIGMNRVMNRVLISEELRRNIHDLRAANIISVDRETGDGHHFPILNVQTGECTFMAKEKPVRRIQIACEGV
jgi:hypothetical protein